MRAIVIAAALAAGAAFAQAPADYLKRVADNYRAAFAVYERDGIVTRERVVGDLFFEPRFDDIDINRDGVITRAELERFLASLPAYAT
jgi:EF hand